MNNAGQVVGTYTDAASHIHGFIRSADGSTYTTVDVPGSLPGTTTAAGINNLGQVLGSFRDTTGAHGYVRSANGSTYTPIDFPVADFGPGVPLGINDQGDIVGYDPVYQFGSAGFLHSAGSSTFTSISYPGALSTNPQSIFNDGSILGWYTVPCDLIDQPVASMHGFLRSPDGTFTSFDLPGSNGFTRPNARNSLGQIAGSFQAGPSGWEAGFVLYPDGSTSTLIVPGVENTVPMAISDSGVLAGTVTYHAPSNVANHGFVATPAMPASKAAIRSVGGVITATGFGAGGNVAPGSWIEVYGQNLSATTRAWQASDFNGNTAPTSLDGVSVKINGLSAYVSYISPGQLNALLPDSIPNGQAQVTVWNGSQSVASGSVTVDATAAGILSWPLYDTRWVMALFPDYVTFVSVPGISSAVPSRAAKAGDIITLYAVGLGPVTPAVPAGQIAAQPNNLAGNLQVLFNSTPATVLYAGSAPGTVGLYQINLIVPAGANSLWGDLSLKLNGVWTAVATYRY